FFFFFFQAEDGIRDFHVTGVQTCALPISRNLCEFNDIAQVIPNQERWSGVASASHEITIGIRLFADGYYSRRQGTLLFNPTINEIGRASCRERAYGAGVVG